MKKENNERAGVVFNFLKEVGRLKKMPRRGWVINQINNPETIAEHIFRATAMSWVLGKRKGGLNQETLLKIAITHDLCEVYAGDTTPYDSVLPKDKKRLKELMKTWPRFSQKEKERNSVKKHEKEKKSLEDLIEELPNDFKKELLDLWMDYENRINPEGRFFSQADRMENFLQAYEYWEYYKSPPLEPWWLWAREFFDEPLLVYFMNVLEYRFHKKEIPKEMKVSFKDLEFFSLLGKLKRKPRREWVVEGIEDAETTAEHVYHLLVLVWATGRENKEIDMEKAIKIALIHDMHEIYAPDFTLYDAAFLSEGEQKERVEEIVPQRKKPTEKQKEKMREIKRESEEEGMKKAVSFLEDDIKEEVYGLWEDYSKKRTVEGDFVRQANEVINLFQRAKYAKEYKEIDCDFWLKKAKENIKDENLLILIEEIEFNLKNKHA